MKSAKKLVKRQICGKNCDQADCEQKNSERSSRDRLIDILRLEKFGCSGFALQCLPR